MSNTKIAIFHNLPGGGSVRYLNEIYRHLSKDYSVDVYTTHEVESDTWVDKITDFKEIVTEIKPWKGFVLRNLWISIMLENIHKNLAKTINSKEYEFVLVTHDSLTKSPFLLRFLDLKSIYLIHEPPREFYESWDVQAPRIKNKIANIFRFYIKYIDFINTKKANVLISNSKYSQDRIKKIYGRDTIVIYPGVHNLQFSPKLNCKKENLILSIGGLAKFKGHYFVINSLKNILFKYKLVIIGDGNKKDRDYLQKISNGIKVEFVNRVSEKKLINYYRKAKVLCIGAHDEPFGMTSIEAQSCGTPVVSVDEGGVKETIIDGKTGYLTKRNVSEFEKKTLLAINDYKKMGRQGIIASKKWGWKNSFSKLDLIIKSLK
jgi:glycosyltransferase involved in cell wall biosynthesis